MLIGDMQSGWTALMMAAQEGHLDVVNVLLDKGANIEARGMVRLFGQFCLHPSYQSLTTPWAPPVQL